MSRDVVNGNHLKNCLAVFTVLVWISQEAMAGKQLSQECQKSILQLSPEPTRHHLGRLTERMAEALGRLGVSNLHIDAMEKIQPLADYMKPVFLENSGIFPGPDGGFIAVSAGAGYGSVDQSGKAENLFGIYRANTPLASVAYPFAPRETFCAGAWTGDERLILAKASWSMRLTCLLVPGCRSMTRQVFLNISNPLIFGDRKKRFFDGALFAQDFRVYTSFSPWHPGGEPDSWPESGWNQYRHGKMDGHFLIFHQANVSQDALMFLKPFRAAGGGFGGTAYSFSYLKDEYLVNSSYRQLVKKGICPAP